MSKEKIDCGCHIEERRLADASGWHNSIVYCAMHEAAPQLVNACQLAVRLLDHGDEHRPVCGMLRGVVGKAGFHV